MQLQGLRATRAAMPVGLDAVVSGLLHSNVARLSPKVPFMLSGIA